MIYISGAVPSITPDEVRGLIEDKPADDYCLLDVRQPMEHQQGRLPGSILIPLGELHARVGELDPKKKVVVYCRSGSRSASATTMLSSAGFDEVLNMAACKAAIKAGQKLTDEEKRHFILLNNVVGFVERPEKWHENAEFYKMEEY